ncbi:hypothetical protein L3X38_020374 [Prunus dulcis]|uniref:Uncharacterized protein n=1 Tax=Prunus dulcis TaxID=3755 RepID=A0AAD4VZG1_PRUDU|nr:hypothetical protein L3X38_023232 [Prunus dulcis]KAI5341100.1 hypothetical protein L3X38_020374 [Prunus dulcis]
MDTGRHVSLCHALTSWVGDYRTQFSDWMPLSETFWLVLPFGGATLTLPQEGGHGCFADGMLPLTPFESTSDCFGPYVRASPMRRLARLRCLDQSFGMVPYSRNLSAFYVIAWLSAFWWLSF